MNLVECGKKRKIHKNCLYDFEGPCQVLSMVSLFCCFRMPEGPGRLRSFMVNYSQQSDILCWCKVMNDPNHLREDTEFAFINLKNFIESEFAMN